MFGFFKKTFDKTVAAIREVLPERAESFNKEAVEEALLACDVEAAIIDEMLAPMSEQITRVAFENALSFVFMGAKVRPTPAMWSQKPFVDMIVGVNGAGKTTTIAKLAHRAKTEGKSVLLGAGDTFRAAACEQLEIWGERLSVPCVGGAHGADPSAVVFDAINAAKARGVDYCILDTAGRLHTQSNLAEELKKIARVASKALEGAPHRTLLVLDATQGHSAVRQAAAFDQMIPLAGCIVTKLDGTAKGGALLSILRHTGLPILYMGTGETPADLAPFDTRDYVKSLSGALFGEG